MSSQAERIKAFRHAQCTRLMKQEEEAWISGEELYTEGSSDEESNNSKTKSNKGTPRKKQSIRPSTCDTEYSNSSSNISDKSDDNTETISDDKICSEKQRFDENFEWRPKRGSLQLPSMSEVVNGALFYESEVFYQEMTHSLKTLKKDFQENSKSEEPVKLSCSEENIDDQQDVKSMLSSSAELDRKINETCELWQQLKVETLGLQKEICSVIEHSGSIEERKSLNCLRSHVVNDDSASPKPGDKESSVTVTKTSTKQTNADRKFIERNIELAKQGNMATYSLTDEEKTKLEELLEDLDSEEYAFEEQDNDPEAEHITKSDDDEADIQIDSERNALNHFKLTKEDEQKMTELEAQMEELLSVYPEKLKPSCFDGEKGDPLKSADKSGRLWKFSELDERLKSIDRELKELLRKDAIETENVINANQAKGQEEVEVGGDEQN